MNEIKLQNKNGQILVSSREVAENFGKRHTEVIRAIDNKLEVNAILRSPNYFIQTTYLDKSNRQSKEYLMTRDGFSFIVMGFTGKEADEWKLKYIEAFNKMEEKLKAGNYLSEEEKLKLQLFSKDPAEVVYAHNRLVELANAPYIEKSKYHDEVLNKEDLITTTVIAKDLGFKSAKALNNILHLNGVIFYQSGTWCPYADYEWLITEGYADYQSYNVEHSSPTLKWTEKGRKWINQNYNIWIENISN